MYFDECIVKNYQKRSSTCSCISFETAKSKLLKDSATDIR